MPVGCPSSYHNVKTMVIPKIQLYPFFSLNCLTELVEVHDLFFSETSHVHQRGKARKKKKSLPMLHGTFITFAHFPLPLAKTIFTALYELSLTVSQAL